MNYDRSMLDKYVYLIVAMFAISLAYSEFLKNLSIVLMLIYFLHQLTTNNISITKDVVNFSLISYLVVVIIGIWAGINTHESIAQSSDIVKIVVVFLFFREVKFKFIKFEDVIKFIIIGFVAAVIVSMVEYYLYGADYLKLHSVGSINRSATYIVYIFVTTLALYSLATSRAYKLLLFFGLLFSSMAIILGGSRMAMFSLPIVFLFYAFLQKNKSVSHIYFIILTLILLLIFTFFFFPDSRIASRFEQGFSDPARVQIWMSAIYAWLEHNVLFGIGVGNSIFIDVGNYFEHPLTRNIDNTHHLYLDLILEKGLLGFISFFTFLGSLWFFKIKQSDSQLIRLLIFSMCLMGLANITFRYEFALLFVMIVGSLLNSSLLEEK